MPFSAVLPVSRAIDDALTFAARHKKRAEAATLRIAVGLSGGRDSMVLLDALSRAASAHGASLSAVHVHHGISPDADRWAEFCAAECARRAVPLTVHRVKVENAAGLGLEAAARAARYAVFETVDADFVALAHHAGDQAETLLLQLLRGAGPHGLAAMPLVRPLQRDGTLLRPFLALPGTAIEAYARARELAWVDDESNAVTTLKRNFLRHEVAPRLAAAFPGYPATLARAAAHQGEAAALLDDLAAIDARETLVASVDPAGALDRRAFVQLASRAPHRARNLLRWFLRRHGLRAPSAARLDAMMRQLVEAPGDARVRLAHDGLEIGIHRGCIRIHPPASAPFAVAWHGEPALLLPHGTLEFAPIEGAGLAASRVANASVVIRARVGGERIRVDPGRPQQAVKRLLQTAGIPHWQRDALPLVWCGERLAAVPGLGVDVVFAAGAGEPGFELKWQPAMTE
jgi:tRNA(Ile)-lysidine synthase